MSSGGMGVLPGTRLGIPKTSKSTLKGFKFQGVVEAANVWPDSSIHIMRDAVY